MNCMQCQQHSKVYQVHKWHFCPRLVLNSNLFNRSQISGSVFQSNFILTSGTCCSFKSDSVEPLLQSSGWLFSNGDHWHVCLEGAEPGFHRFVFIHEQCFSVLIFFICRLERNSPRIWQVDKLAGHPTSGAAEIQCLLHLCWFGVSAGKSTRPTVWLLI